MGERGGGGGNSAGEREESTLLPSPKVKIKKNPLIIFNPINFYLYCVLNKQDNRLEEVPGFQWS